jgi:hypothetical protein
MRFQCSISYKHAKYIHHIHPPCPQVLTPPRTCFIILSLISKSLFIVERGFFEEIVREGEGLKEGGGRREGRREEGRERERERERD